MLIWCHKISQKGVLGKNWLVPALCLCPPSAPLQYPAHSSLPTMPYISLFFLSSSFRPRPNEFGTAVSLYKTKRPWVIAGGNHSICDHRSILRLRIFSMLWDALLHQFFSEWVCSEADEGKVLIPCCPHPLCLQYWRVRSVALRVTL